MSVHTRFSNFISYSGAIWQILTSNVTAGLYDLLHSRIIDMHVHYTLALMCAKIV